MDGEKNNFYTNQNEDNQKSPKKKFLDDNLTVLENKREDFEVNLKIQGEDDEDLYANYTSVSQDDNPFTSEDETVHTQEKKKMDISIILLILSLSSLIGLIGGESLRSLGLIIGIIALFTSMLFISRKNKFSESAFAISLVVVIIYIVIYVVTLTRVDTKVDKTNANLFRERAQELLQSAKNDVLDSGALNCALSGKNEIKLIVPFTDNEKSAFGYEYNANMSYISASAEMVDGECVRNFSIYLTDNNYSLGTIVEPVKEERILKTDVRKVVLE